jgi:hypothetical protein
MARKLRVQYPGAIYHLMNRGDRREPISKMIRIASGSWKPWGRLAPRPAGKCMRIV